DYYCQVWGRSTNQWVF
nr:immunoglobulin light chain junction region [Macaca mulatta]